MPAFSRTSRERLLTAHTDLQTVMEEAVLVSPVDFGIACAFRGKAEQDKAVAEGKSKTPWPTSKHNHMLAGAPCALAADVLPYLDGKNAWVLLEEARRLPAAERTSQERRIDEAFWSVWTAVKSIADLRGVALRYGGDWDGDGKARFHGDMDERFVDLPHIELKG